LEDLESTIRRGPVMSSRLTSFPLFIGETRVSVYEVTAASPKVAPVLFLHGWGLSPRSYSDYLTALSELLSADVISPALPGFGGSDTLRQDASAEHLLSHLKKIVSQLNFDSPPILVGHSLGGALAARLASSSGEQFDSRLVLVSPAGVYLESAPSRGFSEALSMALDLRHEIPNSPIQRMRDAGPSFLRHPWATFQAGWTAAHIDIANDLRAIAQRGIKPGLITADRDRVTPFTSAKATPDVVVKEVHGTHGWILSHPKDAAKITCEILSQPTIA